MIRMITIGAVTSIALASGSAVFAKGHDQGVGVAQGGPFVPTDPGSIEDTKAGAQGLGETLPTVVPGQGFSTNVRGDSKE